MTVRRQPFHPCELNSRLHIQLDRERHSSSNTSPGLAMDLKYALNSVNNRFKLEAYHPIRKMYAITKSLIDYQKLYVPVRYLTAKMQPQLDEYS